MDADDTSVAGTVRTPCARLGDAYTLEPMSQQMMLQSGLTLAPHPPLTAYREDLARRGDGGPFGVSDATWLTVAAILSHAGDVPADARPSLVVTVREVVGGDPALRTVLEATAADPPPEFELDGVSPIVRAIVDRMEDEGALHLAYSMLSVLADADLRLNVIERGRVLAQLGRVAWKTGALDTAREQYRRVEVLGRVSRNPELRVRAWIGYAVLARLRGNYPDMRKWSTRAAATADRVGLVALGSLAYHSLMVSAAVAGDLNAALVYGWRAYQGAIGDSAREAEALQSLSQFLLECGQPEAALRGFAAALERQPAARIALPALGGMALAAAALGYRALVVSTRARTERVIEAAAPAYECANVLLELSQALASVGDDAGAAACRARSLDIAERRAYHEIVHRLNALRAQPSRVWAEAPHVLGPNGTEVARAVASLELVGSAASGG